jgi:hypothetical protein
MTTLTIHTPVGDARLSHPRLSELDDDALARLQALIQADVDSGDPCVNVWHPNSTTGCAPAPQTTPAPVRYQPAAAGDQAPIPAGTEAAGLTDDEDEPAYDPFCTCGMRASDPFHVVDHQFVMAADQSTVPS